MRYKHTLRKRIKILLRRSKPRLKFLYIGLFGASALMLAAAALYIFVWHRPSQPSSADISDLVVIGPLQTSLPTATPIATTRPEDTQDPPAAWQSFEDLQEQNDDFVGWIKVSNTIIDYPVLQAEDNSFYMDKDFYKEYSYPGSIFLDFRCDMLNMSNPVHQIIYGHNMKNGTMFHQLTKYQDESFFRENRYISIDTLNGSYVFEVFAAYETPVSFFYLKTKFKDKDDWLGFIRELQKRSDHSADIELLKTDVVLTLSTCTNSHDDSLRYVVHARLKNKEN